MICNNIAINKAGHLTFAGRDTVELAKQYGTPLYLMDEDKIREHIHCYMQAMQDYFPEGSVPEYASKAFACKQIYRIMAEEGMDIDTVSCGEIYTAFSAGFPMGNCFFHGNNKTDEDIAFAMEHQVGYFILDNEDEIAAVQSIAESRGIRQKALLRVTPGIDPHTHKKISTGSVESKFGVAISTGDANRAVEKVLSCPNIALCGFHCHIGSQIFDPEPFVTAADIMFAFLADVKRAFGITTEILNLGGGFGVRYTKDEPQTDYREQIARIAAVLQGKADANQIPVPRILMEPGRSLVADAGMTLYTVGSVKEITGYKNFISVDGGMTDNPRFALYEAVHTVAIANKADQKNNYTACVAGRCCESGDIIAENVEMPKPCRGDTVAVMTTGAYNYSMASNYNRIARPPVVMLKNGTDYLAVKRETLQDLCALDC